MPSSLGPLRSSRIGSRHRCHCRGKAGRIVRGPARATTRLRPCGDPRLGEAATSHGRGYSTACRPTSGRPEIGAVSGFRPLMTAFEGWTSPARANRECRVSTHSSRCRDRRARLSGRQLWIDHARFRSPYRPCACSRATDKDTLVINSAAANRGSQERGARSTPPRGRIHGRTRLRKHGPAPGEPFRRSCERPPPRECASDWP